MSNKKMVQLFSANMLNLLKNGLNKKKNNTLQ